MDIGDAIKSLRTSRQMTQKEFTKEVLSSSFLSKIENGEHRISAEDLFIILKRNNISIHEFYLMIDTEAETLNHMEKISQAYYSSDLPSLRHLAKLIPYSTISNKKYYQLMVNIIIFILQDDVAAIPKKITEEAKDQLFASQNWNELTLSLLVNISLVYDVDTLEYFLTDILKKKSLVASPIKIVRLIYSLILNLIYVLLLNKKNEKALFYLKTLEQVTATPELAFQKGLLNFYRKLYNHTKKPSDSNLLAIQEAIHLFELLGMEPTVKKLQEYKEKVLLTDN